MKTQRLTVNPQTPEPDAITRAAGVVCAGGLVAFPTETVYGLGANALDEAAVARIFAAKGRPGSNPLIVHVPDAPAALPLVTSFPELAERLADRYWPGPLTLVLAKSERVPGLVTAGGPTVAVRAPGHPVALALLRACGLPLAAPSANPSSFLSPTTPEHVLRGLEGKIDMILDAGPTPGGLESTVLDVTVTPPRLLRPGLVTPVELEEAIGPIEWLSGGDSSETSRSPGLQERHYAPRTPLELRADGAARVMELVHQGKRVGWMTWGQAPLQAVVERMPADPRAAAAALYAALHRLDLADLDCVIVDEPPKGDAWLALRDRLERAQAK